MKNSLIVLLLVLSYTALEARQRSVVLTAYFNGNSSPQGTYVIPMSGVTCGLDPSVLQQFSDSSGFAALVNPTGVAWDDISATDKICRYQHLNGLLWQGPDFVYGSYTMTVHFQEGDKRGPASDPVPFSLELPKPTGVKVIK